MLNDGLGFSMESAFSIATRVYRGGGLTKDAIYLAGLVEVVDYLSEGGALDPLWIGKMSRNHIPIIQELLWREVLKPPTLQPRFLSMTGAEQRLERLRKGVDMVELASNGVETRSSNSE